MDLEKIINSKIEQKILRFFNENPRSIDTAQGIATWTGINQQIIKKTLKKMVRHKILIEHRTSSTRGYSYTNNRKVINAVKSWFAKKDRS